VFRESERPPSYFGDPLPESSTGVFEVVAQPMVRRMRVDSVLQTRIGQWLHARNMLTKLLGTCVVILVGLYMVDPGRTHLQIQDPYSENHMVDVIKSHPATLFTRCCLLTASLFLVFHQVSYDLFVMCIFSFDSLAMTTSTVLCEAALLYELMTIFTREDKFTTLDLMLQTAQAILTVIAHALVSAMDSWMVSVKSKMAVLVPFTLCLMFYYVEQRFVLSWSKREFCGFTYCSTWQGIYLSSVVNEFIFGMKLCVPYLMGRQFAIVKSDSFNPLDEEFSKSRTSRGDSVKFQVGNADASDLEPTMVGKRPGYDHAQHVRAWLENGRKKALDKE